MRSIWKQEWLAKRTEEANEGKEEGPRLGRPLRKALRPQGSAGPWTSRGDANVAKPMKKATYNQLMQTCSKHCTLYIYIYIYIDQQTRKNKSITSWGPNTFLHRVFCFRSSTQKLPHLWYNCQTCLGIASTEVLYSEPKWKNEVSTHTRTESRAPWPQ